MKIHEPCDTTYVGMCLRVVCKVKVHARRRSELSRARRRAVLFTRYGFSLLVPMYAGAWRVYFPF